MIVIEKELDCVLDGFYRRTYEHTSYRLNVEIVTEEIRRGFPGCRLDVNQIGLLFGKYVEKYASIHLRT